MSPPSAPETPSTDRPPTPPRLPRRVRLGPLEAFGLPVLILLPALALAGLLGPTDAPRSATATLGHAHLVLRVRHPSRLRCLRGGALQIEVANTGTQAVPALAVDIYETYLDGFSRADVQPAVAAESRSGRLRLTLPALQPGEHTRVQIRLDAEAWGRRSGWVGLAAPDGAALARIDFTTLVLP